MNKLNKAFAIFLIIFFFLSNTIYAALSSSTHFEVVDRTVCEIDFGENGEFLKQLISYDESSVTLQLEVKNTATESEAKTTSEIFLVIDNSLSLREQVSETETRKDIIYAAAKELSTKLHTADPDFKIGVISFSSNSDISKEGTLEDATLMQTLTTDNSKIISAVDNINETEFGSRTNIEAGLELANQNFSGTADKEYIILITDGVPNNDIHGNTLQYSDIVMENTKNKLLELEQKGISIISVLAGVSDAVEPTVSLTYVELAEKVFGTEEVPTAGKYYFINDSEIKDIIENNVFNDIEIIPGEKLTNIIIKDYFPQKIIDNFDFAHVTSPNLGNVTAEIDSETNCITWTIPELDAGESASLQYKLTLKDNFNKEILDEIIPTNEKVDITDDQGDEETSDDSPKVRVTEDPVEPAPPEEPEIPEDPVTPEPPKEPDVIPDPVLPQTGTYDFIVFFSIIVLGIFGINQYLKYKKN